MTDLYRYPLQLTREQWTDICDHYETAGDDDPEPISEDCMAEDYNRAVDELQGFYPQPDDHDRRYDDFYSQQQGDVGDEEFPY